MASEEHEQTFEKCLEQLIANRIERRLESQQYGYGVTRFIMKGCAQMLMAIIFNPDSQLPWSIVGEYKLLAAHGEELGMILDENNRLQFPDPNESENKLKAIWQNVHSRIEERYNLLAIMK